jgi:putative membrane protein
MTAITWLSTTAWQRGDMMDGDAGWHWAWMAILLVVTLAFLGLIVWAVTRHPAAAAGPGPMGPTGSTNRAREILAERLARGEITVEEYRERLQALG